LRNWLINAFNGEWLKIADPSPIVTKAKLKEKEKERRDVLIGPMLEA
jgi:hypothetical protein